MKFFNINNTEVSFNYVLSQSQSTKIVIDWKSKHYNVLHGDDAVYFQIDNNIGIKLIQGNEDDYNHLKYLQDKNLTTLPHIFSVERCNELIVLTIEHITNKPTTQDHITKCIEEITRHELLPEDEWSKNKNISDGKCIDFHRFRHAPDRYRFPTSATVQELDFIYHNALNRYKKMNNKWKGKIYQEMCFDNGYDMKGYTSDHKISDSYRKLTFAHLQKAKDGVVLDLGCNQGFFSFQSCIHGAKEVIGVDTCVQDLMLAKEIQSYLNMPQIDFYEHDIVEFVNQNSKKKFNLIFLLSVLHQIYPNMVGAEKLLKTLSKMSPYLIFETPINHPKNNIPVQQIENMLNKAFYKIRHCYTYNAYSSGERTIYVCYTKYL